MKKYLILFFLFIQLNLFSQKEGAVICFGAGYSTYIDQFEDLNSFIDSYNLMNAPSTTEPFNNFSMIPGHGLKISGGGWTKHAFYYFGFGRSYFSQASEIKYGLQGHGIKMKIYMWDMFGDIGLKLGPVNLGLTLSGHARRSVINSYSIYADGTKSLGYDNPLNGIYRSTLYMPVGFGAVLAFQYKFLKLEARVEKLHSFRNNYPENTYAYFDYTEAKSYGNEYLPRDVYNWNADNPVRADFNKGFNASLNLYFMIFPYDKK